ALGSITNGTLVQSNGTLLVQTNIQIGVETLTLASIGDPAWGASLASAAGTSNLFGGPVTLAADTIINVASNTVLDLSGVIAGNGSLTKISLGRLEFSGDSDNTHTNVTRVVAGNLRLNKQSSDAVIGPLIIGDDA